MLDNKTIININWCSFFHTYVTKPMCMFTKQSDNLCATRKFVFWEINWIKTVFYSIIEHSKYFALSRFITNARIVLAHTSQMRLRNFHIVRYFLSKNNTHIIRDIRIVSGHNSCQRLCQCEYPCSTKYYFWFLNTAFMLWLYCFLNPTLIKILKICVFNFVFTDTKFII